MALLRFFILQLVHILFELLGNVTSYMVRVPRLTTTERDAIVSPEQGLEVFDTTVGYKSIYNGTIWTYVNYVDTAVANIYWRTATSATATYGTVNGTNWSSSSQAGLWYANNDGMESLQLQTTTVGTYIQYAFGSKPSGIYIIKFSMLRSQDRGKVQVSEVNNSVTIGPEADGYMASSTNAVDYHEFTFTHVVSTSSNMTIRFTNKGKNASSSAAFLLFCIKFVLLRVG